MYTTLEFDGKEYAIILSIGSLKSPLPGWTNIGTGITKFGKTYAIYRASYAKTLHWGDLHPVNSQRPAFGDLTPASRMCPTCGHLR